MLHNVSTLPFSQVKQYTDETYTSDSYPILTCEKKQLSLNYDQNIISSISPQHIVLPTECRTYDEYRELLDLWYQQTRRQFQKFILPIPITLSFLRMKASPIDVSVRGYRELQKLDNKNITFLINQIITKSVISEDGPFPYPTKNQTVLLKTVFSAQEKWNSQLITQPPFPQFYSKYIDYVNAFIAWNNDVRKIKIPPHHPKYFQQFLNVGNSRSKNCIQNCSIETKESLTLDKRFFSLPSLKKEAESSVTALLINLRRPRKPKYPSFQELAKDTDSSTTSISASFKYYQVTPPSKVIPKIIKSSTNTILKRLSHEFKRTGKLASLSFYSREAFIYSNIFEIDKSFDLLFNLLELERYQNNLLNRIALSNFLNVFISQPYLSFVLRLMQRNHDFLTAAQIYSEFSTVPIKFHSYISRAALNNLPEEPIISHSVIVLLQYHILSVIQEHLTKSQRTQQASFIIDLLAAAQTQVFNLLQNFGSEIVNWIEDFSPGKLHSVAALIVLSLQTKSEHSFHFVQLFKNYFYILFKISLLDPKIFSIVRMEIIGSRENMQLLFPPFIEFIHGILTDDISNFPSSFLSFLTSFLSVDPSIYSFTDTSWSLTLVAHLIQFRTSSSHAYLLLALARFVAHKPAGFDIVALMSFLAATLHMPKTNECVIRAFATLAALPAAAAFLSLNNEWMRSVMQGMEGRTAEAQEAAWAAFGAILTEHLTAVGAALRDPVINELFKSVVRHSSTCSFFCLVAAVTEAIERHVPQEHGQQKGLIQSSFLSIVNIPQDILDVISAVKQSGFNIDQKLRSLAANLPPDWPRTKHIITRYKNAISVRPGCKQLLGIKSSR